MPFSNNCKVLFWSGQITMAVAVVVGVVVYRVATSYWLVKRAQLQQEFFSYYLLIVNTSAAVINLIFIFFFDWVSNLCQIK